MTDQPNILDVMARFLDAMPEPVDRKVHVSEHAWRYLREKHAKTVRPEVITTMFGLPIVVDADLSGGQWQLRENGEVTKSGDMAPAPEGMNVFYSPLSGWLAIREDLAPVPAGFSWTTP